MHHWYYGTMGVIGDIDALGVMRYMDVSEECGGGVCNTNWQRRIAVHIAYI